MSGHDEVMSRISAAIERSQSGDREWARQRFSELWKELSPDGDRKMIRAGIERLARRLSGNPVE
jgi:hypothetical protein